MKAREVEAADLKPGDVILDGRLKARITEIRPHGAGAVHLVGDLLDGDEAVGRVDMTAKLRKTFPVI